MRQIKVLGGAVLFVACFLALVSTAPADHSFCLFGPGPGQCDRPQGVAVDEASGNVYVVDRGNNRINVFSPAGPFLFSFGTAGGGAGQFNSPTSIAIDNDPLSPSFRHVYVGTDGFRVQKFDHEGNFVLAFGGSGTGPGQFRNQSDPIAVGPGGTVYVADSPSTGGTLEGGELVEHRIERFSDTGALLGECALEEPSPSVPSQTQAFEDLAVDSSGDAYVVFGVGFGVFKYEMAAPVCTAADSLDAGGEIQTRALSDADSADNVYAYQSNDSVPIDFITKYGPSGATLSRFGYGAVGTALVGLAVGSGSGDLFGSERNDGGALGNRVIHIDPPPPGPLIVSTDAGPIGNVRATLRATINPEGETTAYHFEYVDEATYQADIVANGPGHGFDSARRVPASAGEDSTVGASEDFDLHPVSAQVGCPDPATEAPLPESKCLRPETDYRFRVFAGNADGGGNSPVEGEFTTRPAFELVAIWPGEVGTNSARLNAEINPQSIPAVGRFEYVDEATYAVSGFANATVAPAGSAAPFDFGAGESPVVRGLQLDMLSSGTAYRFRLMVDNPLVEPVTSGERSFVTQAPPLLSMACPNDVFRTGPSTYLPNCRAYEMVSPVDKENGDIVAVGNVSSNPAQQNKSAAGGERFTYSSYRAFGDAQSAPFTSQYLATRYPTPAQPGKEGWESHGISPPRGINILGNNGTLDVQFKAFSEDLCTGWLLHDTDPPLAPGAPAGFGNLYQRRNCSPGEGAYAAVTTSPPPTRDPKFLAPELQGLSEDGTRAVYRADDQLTPNANPGKAEIGSNFQCYEASGGKQRLVSILPNGTASKLPCSIGTAYDINDGRSDAVGHAISGDGSRIFWSATPSASIALGPGHIYVRIDGKNPTVDVSGSVSNEPARFWTAAADGSKAVFTIAKGLSEDLYEFDVDKREEHRIAGEVEGLLGADEAAERIYFVSREDLGGGASDGDPNLYLYRAGDAFGTGSSVFIGTLGEGDVPVNNNIPSPVGAEPYFHTAQVSRDGLHAAFMSTASLTGYDNVDANSGEPDAEVYLYDAPTSGGGGTLACISCNPTEARPAGRELRRDNGFPIGVWAAAQLPTAGSQLYASRVLSADGNRLFFESYEALATRDTNGRQDVYQWERGASEADCAQRGAEQYVAGAGGCLSLISSGESAKDSAFVDAGADGSDVFVATDSSLVSHDPGLIDIYDARIGGGFPPPPAPRPPCQGEACQSPPAPPSALTPASSSFRGNGNVSRGGRCAKGKRKVRRNGKVRCVRKQKQRTGGGSDHRRGGSRR